MRSIFIHHNHLAIKKLLVYLTAAFFVSFNSAAQTPPDLVFTPVVSGLNASLDVVNAGDGTNRLFIVQRGGTVRIVSAGVLLPGIFLDIPDSISSGGESGLLSMAFHPDYENNRYFFVYYTNTAGDLALARFQTQAGDPNAADESTGVILMVIPHPTFSNHNGGKLNFGPDGNLYLAIGDGGSGGDPANNSQNGNVLLGKMIRLNVDDFATPPYYSIPPDNPYVADPLVRDEIFALGLRNPWRWSFDRLTNEVWIADVGQGIWEEVNSLPFASSGGINYGWRCYEGNAPYNTAGCLPQAAYVSPIFVYPHIFATGGFSVTGGYVYRGAEYPTLFGNYICADYVSGNVWLINPDGGGGWNSYIQSGLPGNIAGFGEAENADLYALSLGGTLYKVDTLTVVLPATLLEFTAKAFKGYNELRWKTTNEQNLAGYEIGYSFNGVDFETAGNTPAMNGTGENNYSFQHAVAGFTRLFYRLKIKDIDGRIKYSDILTVDKKLDALVKVYPMPITRDACTIISDQPVAEVALYSMDGREVFRRKLNNVSGTINIPLPHLQDGVYMMQVKLKNETVNNKVVIQH
jgi:glucose/arabinose dehydrogenase